MAYEFKRLADVEALREVPENATVLAEVNGSIKRVPGNGLGGSGNGIVIVMEDPNASPRSSGNVTPVYTFTANMDFADAIAAFRNHEITSVVVYGLNSVMNPSAPNAAAAAAAGAVEGYQVMDIAAMADMTSMAGIDCLVVNTLMSQMRLYWTANGISTEAPGSRPV